MNSVLPACGRLLASGNNKKISVGKLLEKQVDLMSVCMGSPICACISTQQQGNGHDEFDRRALARAVLANEA